MVMLKSRRKIESKIAEIRADARYTYPTANVFSNAPLALIQVEMKAQVRILEWVLGIEEKEKV